MRLPIRRKLRIYQGDDWRLPIRGFLDSTRAEKFDLSDQTYAMTIRDSVGGSVLEQPTAVAADGDQWDLVLTDTETAALTPGTYVYDVELTAGTEQVTLMAGPIVVEGQVT